MDLLVSGWEVAGITLYHSGFWLTPYFPSSLSDPSGTGPSYRSVKQQNPDCVSGVIGYCPAGYRRRNSRTCRCH